ncbi:hypothetical protein C8R42DRAFT_721563 [Lentinula raphanica]|nr:hypothetical protein C8R42DRAFT_721563 [Lentinula raphanica]
MTSRMNLVQQGYALFLDYLEVTLIHAAASPVTESVALLTPPYPGPSDSRTESILKNLRLVLEKRVEEPPPITTATNFSGSNAASMTDLWQNTGQDNPITDTKCVHDSSQIESESLKQQVRSEVPAMRFGPVIFFTVAEGDLSQKITLVDPSAQNTASPGDEITNLTYAVNRLVDMLGRFTLDLQEATLNGLAFDVPQLRTVPPLQGVWYDALRDVCRMYGTWTNYIRAIAIVITAICRGDITKKLDIALRCVILPEKVTGEMLDLKVTINAMVDQLGLIAGEVNRAVLEGSAHPATQSRMYLEQLGGSWKELQDNVDEHLLCQMNEVRALSEVMRAIHQGKLDTYFDLEAQGEMLDLKDTVSNLTPTLCQFAGSSTFQNG